MAGEQAWTIDRTGECIEMEEVPGRKILSVYYYVIINEEAWQAYVHKITGLIVIVVRPAS